MADPILMKPFSGPFISEFFWSPDILPFKDSEMAALDHELSVYEQVFLNPDIEKNLISKNELLASFAISKAENSQLTLQEAQDVYNLLRSDPSFDFIRHKLKAKKDLSQKDYDKLEFFNIAASFRTFNQKPMTIDTLTPMDILTVHSHVTRGLDIFKKYLSHFTVYKSGTWRNNNEIRVGTYIPAPCTDIETGVRELIGWLKNHQTITGIAAFHAALYGLHPFNNGNKRVCRILEHVLLRSIGLNRKNLYSTSYYYHKQKARYYKHLLFSLERKNLNHFISFIQESFVLSVVDVVKTSLEAKRHEFIKKLDLEGNMLLVLKPFVKRRELQFKHLARITKGKIARQTLVTYLSKAVRVNILTKRETGRVSYYRLSYDTPEESNVKKWVEFVTTRLSFIPEDLRFV